MYQTSGIYSPLTLSVCALLKEFGLRGDGLFPAASVIGKDIEGQYNVRFIGTVPGVKERLYAVAVERRIKHPAVAAICDTAEEWFDSLGRGD